MQHIQFSCFAIIAIFLSPAVPLQAQDDAKPLHKTAYRVFDFHHHCDTPSVLAIQSHLEVLDAVGVDKLAVLDGGWTTGNLLTWVEICRQYPDRLVLFANIDFSKADNPTFSEDIVRELVAQHRLGIRAIKIFKRFGMYHRLNNGELLRIDDPRLDAYFEKCGELGLPVLIHSADPKEYFFPRTHNSFHFGVPNKGPSTSSDDPFVRWEQFGEPEYWKDPKMPKFDEIIRQRDSLLAKHPNTTFVGAHMGSLTFELDRLGETLDKYPNFYVECSARLRILGRLNPHAVRDFFIKYQDRILYGTDSTALMHADPDDPESVRHWKERAKRLHSRHLEYFETDATDIVEPFSHQRHWLRLAGVKLPEGVLKKFYFENAAGIIPGLKGGEFGGKSEKRTALGGTSNDWSSELPIVEREARSEELIAYPVDGKSAGVNPPGFCWTPHDDARKYRIEVIEDTESVAIVLSADGLISTVYPPSHPLEPGEYRWQVVYVDSAGDEFGRSKARSFSISGDTPKLPMPDIAKLRDELANIRPRLFLTGDRLEIIRQEIEHGNVDQWDYFLAAADAALEEGPYAEPKGYANNKFNASDWRRIYSVGKTGSAHLARTALAYKLTGNKKYLAGAKRWLMNLASWDPRGIVSHDVPLPDGAFGNDEASMALLERMAFAWDWIGEELSPEERKIVLEVMTERGNQLLALLHEQDFLSCPFENHEGRSLAFLGNAGLSFLGDIPDAERWLDYVVQCYLTSFPGWGDDGGGWAQGTSYWGAYVYWLSTFAESLRGVTDVDILRRPFYRNNGHFPLYFHPPYAPMDAFGDGGAGKPTMHEKMLIEYWANTFDDPVLQWHAQSISSPAPPLLTDAGEKKRWNEWYMEDVISVLRAGSKGPRPQAPTMKPESKVLPNIGWAVMHSAFGDAENDVWALFKSSRFGSFSHSHGDQNTFQLHAFGEALAIDSGYYPFYGSPHHELWTRQTQAHNGILVNSRGQATRDWNASGSIQHFEQTGNVTIVRGEAATAYNQPPSAGVAQLWQERLGEPHPPRDAVVESFERTVAFVTLKERSLFVVYDYLKTDCPASSDWLLHALNEMEVDPTTGAMTIRQGKARLAVRLLASEPIEFSQSDKFSVPPGERAKGSPPQWHLTAHTTSDAEETKFLAIMIPYRESESPPTIEVVDGENTVGFRVDGTTVAAWWGPGKQGPISTEGVSGSGRLLVDAEDTDP